MSEILVNTIKKADGTGGLTVPSGTGTVVTTDPSVAGNLTTTGDLVLDAGFSTIFKKSGTTTAIINQLGLSLDGGSNYLDDYEEGTFTPTLSFTNGNGSITYQTRVGAYTKIGNRVTVNVYIRISNLGGASGDCRISGWPYTPSSASSVYTITPLWLNTTVSGQIFDGDFYMVGLMSPGDATLRPYALSGAGGMNHLNNGHLQNTTDFMVHMSYPV